MCNKVYYVKHVSQNKESANQKLANLLSPVNN